MKVAGIGRDRAGGSYDADITSEHHTTHSTPAEDRLGRAAPTKYFYARRMCTGGTGDYLCIVLQYMNGSCQEF